MTFSAENWQQSAEELARWYREHRRPLPWRATRDPYRIWLSEVMLQQTTVAAVIPYYERFLQAFPTVHDLASRSLQEVLEQWAGLGYYSRARNLHKAAQVLAAHGFPKTADELLQIPGFGPYTSRAVASLAFGEKVGVLDGNVIRVLSRFRGEKLKWWMTADRKVLQEHSDRLSRLEDSSDINQALMELGATVCTPQKPLCSLCPWTKHCQGRKKNLVETLPLRKPKRESEVWVWKVQLIKNKAHQLLLVKNDYAPFLKGQMLFPGLVLQRSKPPKTFDLKHSITHHLIYVEIEKKQSSKKRGSESLWIAEKDIKKINPSSLLQKILGAS
ncbi:MAG: A/G-specific adenine glycosylase [Pseudobdellovibrionaceae bacterium]